MHPGRPDARQPHAAALSDLCRPRRRARASGTSTATSTSTTSAATARCCSATAIRPCVEAIAAPGAARHALGRLARAGGALGRAGQPPDPVRRAGALHRLRHRGLASGAAARPRLHRQAEGDPLRRPLPRLARRRGGRRHVAFRGRRARRHSRRPGRADRSCCRPTMPAASPTRSQARDDVAAVILEPSGASWGQVPLPAGFLAELREHHARARRRPDLRRGDHRLSLVARRRAGALRHHARHVHARQDRRRRPARRRRRRPRRHHGPARRRGRQGGGPREDRPPGHLQRQPAVRGRRRRHARRSSSARTSAPGPSARPRRSATACASILVEEQIPWGIYGEASAFLIFQNPEPTDDRSRHVRSARARLQGPEGRAQPRSRLSPAHRHARQRRRHHGRAGRPGLGRCTGRARWRTRSRPSAPPCAGSRPRATSSACRLRLR